MEGVSDMHGTFEAFYGLSRGFSMKSPSALQWQMEDAMAITIKVQGLDPGGPVWHDITVQSIVE